MTEHPLISICIPAYQRVHYLKRLLDSILVQTYRNYELIITDDSPDDSVAELVKEYGAKLEIQYSRNQPAAGTPANWNIAIGKSTGDWIKLMHDDDWFATTDALQKFADAAQISSCNFIFSACNNIHASGKEVNEFLSGWRKDMLEEDARNLFFLNAIGHPSTVMHRRDDSVLYDTQFKWVVDVDFYIRYLETHKGYHYIPEMLINIGTDDTQVSSSLYKNPYVELPEYLTMLAKFPPGLMMRHEYVFHCIWNMMKRYRIGHSSEIAKYGYTGPLPDNLQGIIDYQKKIPRIIIKQPKWSELLMKKCYRKIRDQGLNK